MSTDFLVIGGGIAGASAAARLSELDKVLLVEAEEALAWHASGRSAALFEPNYGAPSVVALSRASEAHLASAHGGVLSPRGILMVGLKGEEARFAPEAASMGMEEISLAEAAGMVPILDLGAVSRAAYSPVARDIDTDRLIGNFLRDARANGAEVRLRAPVTAIARTRAGWRVTVGGEETEARVIVNAAGAWADRIAALAGLPPIGLQPMRRSVARVPAPEGHDVSRWPMLFGLGESWYAKPDAGQLIVSPAEEHPMEPHDAWADDMVIAEGIARFSQAVTHEVRRVTATWAGLRTFAPDRTLVLGPDPLEPSFVWSAGQGGYGFQTSPAASQLVADRVAGRASTLDAATLAATDPARFRR